MTHMNGVKLYKNGIPVTGYYRFNLHGPSVPVSWTYHKHVDSSASIRGYYDNEISTVPHQLELLGYSFKPSEVLTIKVRLPRSGVNLNARRLVPGQRFLRGDLDGIKGILRDLLNTAAPKGFKASKRIQTSLRFIEHGRARAGVITGFYNAEVGSVEFTSNVSEYDGQHLAKASFLEIHDDIEHAFRIQQVASQVFRASKATKP